MNKVPQYFIRRAKIQLIFLWSLIFPAVIFISIGIYNLYLLAGENQKYEVLHPGSLKQDAYIRHYEKVINSTPALFTGGHEDGLKFINGIAARSLSPVTSYFESVTLSDSTKGFMKMHRIRLQASCLSREFYTLLDNLSESGLLLELDSLNVLKTDDNEENLVSSSRLFLTVQIIIYALSDSLYAGFKSSYSPVKPELARRADIFYGYGFFSKDPPDVSDLILIKFSEAGAHFENEDGELFIFKAGDTVKNGVVWELNEAGGKVKFLNYAGKPEITEISVTVR